jgi:3-oxoacyl-[acyl-carrier protein] reductase/bacilysin biosynthesis oxidoreductase BacG
MATDSLAGKIALVSGGSMGIGLASAKALANAGAELALTARNADRLAAVADEIRREHGREVLTVSADLREPDAGKSILDAVRKRFGHLDFLVHSAGYPQSGDWRTLPDEAWVETWQLKLMGAVRLTRAALPLMSRGARIVYINGTAGREPSAGFLPGAVTNAGLRAFTKAVARDLAPQGILVNAISPGPVAAGGTLRRLQQKATSDGMRLEEAVRQAGTDATLTGQYTQPDEIAQIVVFLCSASLATLTGTEVVIDGGNSHGI